jgi:hypothetical protein
MVHFMRPFQPVTEREAKRVIEAHMRRRAAQFERLPEAAFAIE